MGTIFSRVKLSGKHVAALLALMLLSAVTAMLLPTALASMIDIGVAGENRNTILIIAAVMATLAILGCLFNMAATVLSAKVSTKFAADLRREIFHQVQDFSAAEMERFGTASLVTRSTSDVTNIQMFLSLLLRAGGDCTADGGGWAGTLFSDRRRTQFRAELGHSRPHHWRRCHSDFCFPLLGDPAAAD